jgi:hypothetical protein
VRYLGFVETLAVDWYVSLRHPEQPASEIAFLDPRHGSVPAGYASPSRGLLVNIEVPDARQEYERLVNANGLVPVLPLRDEAFGGASVSI